MFEELNDYLDEISEALGSINGTLGTVKIENVFDAAQVAYAVSEVERIIDGRLSQHMNNATVAHLAAKMKAGYRLKMLEAVEAKKAELGGHRSPRISPLLPPNPALPSTILPSGRARNLTGIPMMHGHSLGRALLGWPSARSRTRRP